MEGKEVQLDIGAGDVGAFLRQARENPEKMFIAIEPGPGREWKQLKNKLPSNLFLLNAEITPTQDLPFRDNSIDEVNIDFVFSLIEGFEQEDEERYNSQLLFPRLMLETARVLKPEGKLFIRDYKDTIEKQIEPLLRELNLPFESGPMDAALARQHSMYTREALGNFERGDTGSQPYLTAVVKS